MAVGNEGTFVQINSHKHTVKLAHAQRCISFALYLMKNFKSVMKRNGKIEVSGWRVRYEGWGGNKKGKKKRGRDEPMRMNLVTENV